MSTIAQVLNPFVWLRKTYEWTLKWAEHKRSEQALSILAFFESFIFPVPPDVLLMVMGAAKPKRALRFALLCSVFSILGGIAGYALGHFAWLMVRDFFFQFVFSEALFQRVGSLFEENAFFAVFTAAFTPIPFKVFTVAAGAFEISFVPFLAGALVGRPLRFFAVGTLLYFFGAPVKTFVEKYFNLLSVVFTILLVGGFLVLRGSLS